MIDFELTEEHKILRDSVRQWAEGVKDRIVELDRKHETDPEILYDMGRQGFLGICIPEKYGGAGMDYISLAILCEELERVDTSLRVPISVHVGLNSLTLLQWANEEQKQKYLIPQAEGKKLAAFGLTEPNAGSDAKNIQTTAVKEGDYYIINGSKAWISLGDTADHIIIFARTGPKELGHKSISAFIIERGYKGFSSQKIKGKLGVRAGDTSMMYFHDMAVPAENLLGEEGEGFKIAMSALDNGRYTVGAGSVGLAKAAMDEAINYAKTRIAFGKPIAEFQLIQQKIAYMVRGIESAELLIWKAGWMKNKGYRNTKETSLAKWHATDIAMEVADMALQIFGAYGYSDEYPIERFFRNARGARIYEGTAEIHQLIQASYALGYRKDKPLRKELPPWPFPDDV